MFIYSVIFALIVLVYLMSIGQKVPEAVIVIFIAIFFVFFAGLRGDGVSRDYINYKATFSSIKSFSEYFKFTYLEPAYYFFPSLLKELRIFSFPLIFTLFSLMGVSLKMTVIYKYSNFLLLSVLVYYSQYFLLHEMTQIRIGVAAGFLLLSLKPLIEKRRLAFFCYIFAATLFHYSSAIFLIVLFLDFEYLNRKIYFSLLIGAILIAMTGYDVIKLIAGVQLGLFSQKLSNYIGARAEGIMDGEVNKFNILSLLNIGLAVLYLIKWEIIQKNNKYGVVMIKLFVVSNISFYVFSSFIVFAWRLSELFGIVQIILLPCLIYVFNPKWIGVILVIFISFLTFYVNVYHSNLLNSYF